MRNKSILKYKSNLPKQSSPVKRKLSTVGIKSNNGITMSSYDCSNYRGLARMLCLLG